MWVELSQYLWHGFLHQVIDVDRIHILIINDMQQVVQLVAAGIDDAQTVAREVVGIKSAYQDTYHHAYSHDDGHESVFVVCHCYFIIPLFRHSPR